jgi:hypothetical protein
MNSFAGSTIWRAAPTSCGAIFDAARPAEELSKIEERLAAPDFWKDQAAAQKVMQRRRRLEDDQRLIESLRRRGDDLVVLGEWEARRVDADDRQIVAGVALIPGPQIGERPHGVELREVEEMDEDGPPRHQPVDGVDRLADPFGAGRQGRNGDVGPRGTQTPEGMLLRSPRHRRFQ